SQFLTGNETIISGTLTLVDPILIATPLAGLAAIVITLITPPPSEQTNEKCEK
ncbi:hypothetical protein J2T59_002051, partial [Methanosalsum natronophilum]|nr:hypothetical protein [Methanosalsum natronophilum]